MIQSAQSNLLRSLAQESRLRREEESLLVVDHARLQQVLQPSIAEFVNAANAVSFAQAEYELLIWTSGAGIPVLRRRLEKLNRALEYNQAMKLELEAEAAQKEQLFLLSFRTEPRNDQHLLELRIAAEDAALRLHECEQQTTTLSTAVRCLDADVSRLSSESDYRIRRARENLELAEQRYARACEKRRECLDEERLIEERRARLRRHAG